MRSVNEILKQYWGYDSFRPLQESIINSVINGNNCIGLMATGGGKSMCYQVPALYMQGTCLVISPLIALMHDQVDALRAKKINAIALTSEIDNSKVEKILDDCVDGMYKFLFLSPEKLLSNKIRERLKYLNLSFVAVDEAHCISQWGHDFRPSYLRIKSIKELQPHIKILALTATATTGVLQDIKKYLEIENTELFKGSFTRENLSLNNLEVDDKMFNLIDVLNKNKGSSVVYVRSRKKTYQISQILNQNGISANFYHAGIDKRDKIERQNNWMLGNTRVMVATNAFGMGIDKSDVRTVVHLDLPDSLEAYTQEAGRAGRDGELSKAFLFYDNYDIDRLKNFHSQNKAELEDVAMVLKALYSKYNIANMEIDHRNHSISLAEFAHKHKIDFAKLYNCISLLDKEGVISFFSNGESQSKVKFKVSNDYLIGYRKKNEYLNTLIEYLLRNYPGIVDDFAGVDEYKLSNKFFLSTKSIKDLLQKLASDNIIDYREHVSSEQLRFLQIRDEKFTLSQIAKSIKIRNQLIDNRLDFMIKYTTSDDVCRNRLIAEYFDQPYSKDCGMCDYCLSSKVKINLSEVENLILQQLKIKDLDSRTLQLMLNLEESPLLEVLESLLERGLIIVNPSFKYSIKELK